MLHLRLPLSAAILIVAGLGVAARPTAPDASVVADAFGLAETLATSSVEDLVVLTEDRAVYVDGCDAISVFNMRTGALIQRGPTTISPGRLAAAPDLSTIVAVNSNGAFLANNKWWPFIHHFGERGADGSWRTGLLLGNQPYEFDHLPIRDDVATLGAAAISLDGSQLLVATSSKDETREIVGFPNQAPFAVRKYRLPAAVAPDQPLGQDLGALSVSGVAIRIFPSPDRRTAHVVTADGSVLTLDIATMAVVGRAIAFEALTTPTSSANDPPLEYMHATISADERYLVMNRGGDGDLSIVDRVRGRSERISLGTTVKFAGGVAFNRGWLNSGLLALHAGDQVLTLRVQSDGTVDVVGRVAIDPPMCQGRADLAEFCDRNGPHLSIAWSASGDRLIAAASNPIRRAEFMTIDVSDTGVTLRRGFPLIACTELTNYPNDILTANGFITPTTTPTHLPTVTTTPATPTSVPTDTTTATPLPSAPSTLVPTALPSATRAPVPVYLPLLLREQCTPTARHVDVALVLDASTSMLEPVATGGTNLDAARAAAQVFLGELNLDAGDQAAIVMFNDSAELMQELTSDRALLDRAFNRITTHMGTRIHSGLAVAAAVLTGPRHDPANTPVIVLLTDGRANPEPPEVAVEAAAAAKSAGITIFAIGLGGELAVDALRSIASRPEYFYHAPAAADLERIYRTVAGMIPCQVSGFWGRR